MTHEGDTVSEHMKEKLYHNVDIFELDRKGNYYCKHLMAMTGEDLRSKSDIAAQLGIRDFEIDQLKARNAALEQQLAASEQQRGELQAKYDKLQAHLLDLRDDFSHAEPAFNRIEWLIAKSQGVQS